MPSQAQNIVEPVPLPFSSLRICTLSEGLFVILQTCFDNLRSIEHTRRSLQFRRYDDGEVSSCNILH